MKGQASVTYFMIITITAGLVPVPFTQMHITQTQNFFEQFGPRVKSLLIKIYENTSRVFEGLENGEVDIVDRNVPSELVEKWSNPPYNETIAVEKYPYAGAYFLDINNNETVSAFGSWRSPTSYIEFRHAIAHLVNKTEIVMEILQGYGLSLDTPVMPWTEWFNPEADTHPYDPAEAAAILDAAGFIQGTTPNPYYNPSNPGSAEYIRVYPPGHEKTGQNLDPLIFYVRHDQRERNQTGYMIRDELLSMGIPVEIPGPVGIQQIIEKVMISREYHLYTGGWRLTVNPDYMYALYHSGMYWSPGFSYNYNHINDEELDYWLEMLYTAKDKETALNASFNAQRRLAEIAGVVPLWCPLYAKACNRVSERAPLGWDGIINHNMDGVDGWWTFLNAHPMGQEQGGTMVYGFSSDIVRLNPVYSEFFTDWQVLDKVYESLLKYDPYFNSYIPWLVKGWQVKHYETENSGWTVTFNLRENIYWHDGMPFTSEDVKFTMEFFAEVPNQLPIWCPWLRPFVDIDTPDPYTVIFHIDEDIFSLWWIYDIGSVIILPKHVWEDIPPEELSGFAPDPNLIGTGPYRFVEYVEGSHILLKANDEYFKYCPIQTEIRVGNHSSWNTSINYTVSITNAFSDRYVETTVSVYFNETCIDTQTLTMPPLSSIELGPYNIAPLQYGFYKIKVEHSADGYLNRSCVATFQFWVTIREDITRDYKVDIVDVALAALAFGSSPGSPRWNILADVNGDWKIDILDVADIASKFGWSE